jgi:alkylhydroperoxidase family enzyme
MMSASPDIVGLQGQFFKYFRAHPRLGFKLQALIRYLVAADLGYSYCVAFNGNLLHSVGLTDVELEAVHADLAQAPLEDKEKALLSFVMVTLRQPEQTQDAEIAALRAAGWQDSDIFDALWIGAGMIAAGTLYKALSRPGAPGGA